MPELKENFAIGYAQHGGLFSANDLVGGVDSWFSPN